MSGSYSIDVDAQRSFVRMKLQGFFSPEEIVAFDAARREAYRQLRCAPNQHVTLVDMTATQIQSQEAVNAFSHSLMDPVTRSRRIAFLVSRSLARLQIKRASSSLNAAYFHAEDDAIAWLGSDGVETADPAEVLAE